VALYQTILAIMVSTSLLALAKVPIRAEESARELRVEATVPSYGYSHQARQSLAHCFLCVT
jgi:hypothetical protein